MLAPPPPARQPHSGFQQGSCRPHKGNGKIVSHPEARLLPGLLTHNRTFVRCPRRTRRTAQGGRHCRALSNAQRGKASPQEAGPTSGHPPLQSHWCRDSGKTYQVPLCRHLLILLVPCKDASYFAGDCILHHSVRSVRPGGMSFKFFLRLSLTQH